MGFRHYPFAIPPHTHQTARLLREMTINRVDFLRLFFVSFLFIRLAKADGGSGEIYYRFGCDL